MSRHAAPNPVPRQRAGAYAICVRDGHILLTQLSSATGGAGRWTLPGGGIEHGEHPRDTAIRETYEETGLQVELGALLDVDSRHFVGTAPDGTWEDFHGLRVIYAGTIASEAVPRPVEVDGTTAAAAWVPVADVRRGEVDAVVLVHHALDALGV